MIKELRQPLWMETPKGRGQALFLRDPGHESDVEWCVAIYEGPHTGELWWTGNAHVRLLSNWTLRRGEPARPVSKECSADNPILNGSAPH